VAPRAPEREAIETQPPENGHAAGRAAAAADGVKPYTTVRLFFGTDRNRTGSTTPADVFGEDRGEALIFGTCEVSIPRGHQPGELETPFILRRAFESPERHVVLLSVTPKSRDEVFAQMAVMLANRPERTAFVFVHGFNNSFEDAARRTAQIYYDVGFDGVPLFYSWPSKGKANDYSYDLNNADQAVAYMKVFLGDLAASGEFDSITLVAHSMGSRALTRAFMELIPNLPGDQVAKFSELILAAPDIDADVFRNDIAPALVAAGKPVTVYASAKDLAMVASKDFGGYPRLGDARNGIVVIRGVESVDATEVDTNLFWGIGHSYVADSPQMLHDLHDLLVARLRAAQRGDLEEVSTAAGAYWRFK
jgi:esterase/lipase superfamily enzyme